jgi:hypothetical protein
MIHGPKNMEDAKNHQPIVGGKIVKVEQTTKWQVIDK